MTRLICLYLTVLFVLTQLSVKASHEPYFNELRGVQVRAGNTLTVTDEKFRTLTPEAWSQLTNLSVKSTVSFAFNADTSLYFQGRPFSATLHATVHFYANQSDTAQETAAPQSITLRIVFDTTAGRPYKGVAMYKFDGAYKFRLVIDSISSPELAPNIPAVFQLTGKTVIERKYPFSDNSTDVSLFQLKDQKKLLINWTPVNYPGAEFFDLEYTVIDSLSPQGMSIRNSFTTGGAINIPTDTLDLWFKNNATRVTLAENSYLINLVYNSGYILWRLRGVQIHYPDNVRWEGNWNYNATDGTTPQSAAVVIPWHESSLNWQYNASFAEEGRKKEVMQYYDGTLRGRQTVTINNSDQVSVVQETLYDPLGRPAVSVLPAPVKDTSLHYFTGFNRNAAGEPYSYSDITVGCLTTGAAMSNLSGAAKYYSSGNDLLQMHRDYVPAAFQYPYSLTTYTSDATGRLRMQGGVGPQFQPGTGHETTYFYGKPTQTELDRLFGSEAGNASHFLKNMVADPNGGISVSYVNASGKTVATALAGKSPDNLIALSSNTQQASTIVTNELIGPGDFMTEATSFSMSASATFTAPVTGQYAFTYKVDPLKYLVNYGQNSQSKICNTCYYNLEISVLDACKNVLQKTVVPAGNIFDTTCSYSNALLDSFQIAINKVGEYYVNYTLAISKDALDYYDSVHLVKNTDLKTHTQFLSEELQKADFKDCFTDCATCEVKLGTQTHFLDRFKPLYKSSEMPFVAGDSLYLVNLYAQLYAQCMALQNTPGCTVSPCADKLSEIKRDVSPGGQYGLFDAGYLLIDPQTNVLQYYQLVKSFPDADGNPDSVMLKNQYGDDSLLVAVPKLSQKDFIRYFRDSWADSLARFHPEYCYYLWCTQNSNNYSFDKKIKEGYDNAVRAQSAGFYDRSDVLALLKTDPFFSPATYGGDSTLFKQMRDSLLHFTRTVAPGLPDRNLLQYIDALLYCKEQSNPFDGCYIDPNCRSAQQEWKLYRELYFNLKQSFYERARRSSPSFADCNNCYIGQDNLQAAMGNAPAPTGSGYVAYQPTNCTNSCPDGIYNSEKPGIKLFIQSGSPSAQPNSVPQGFNMPSFKTYYVTGTGGSECSFYNVWVAVYDSACPPPCTAPPSLHVKAKTQTSITYAWTHAFPMPINYTWRIYKMSAPTVIVQSGSVNDTTVTVSGLTGNSEYRFEIRSNCSSTNNSGYASIRCYTALPPATLSFSCSDDNCNQIGLTTLHFNFPQATTAAITLHFGEIVATNWGAKFARGYDLFTIPSGVSPYPAMEYGNVPFEVTIPAGVTHYSTSGLITLAYNAQGSFNYWDCHDCLLSRTDIYMKVISPTNTGLNISALIDPATRFYNLSSTTEGSPQQLSCSDPVYPTTTQPACAGTVMSSSCADDPRAPLYTNKTRVFGEYVNPAAVINALQSASPAVLQDSVAGMSTGNALSMCESQAEVWIQTLSDCTTDTVKLAQLKAALIQICVSGAAKIPGSLGTSSTDENLTYKTFEQAIIGILGAGAINQNCTAELLAVPYPHNRQPKTDFTPIDKTDYDICKKITTYQNMYAVSGFAGSFHAYLKAELKDDYVLDSLELVSLIKACTSCNNILDEPIALPLAFTPGINASVNCTTIDSLINRFALDYPNIADTATNYERILTNYLNHRLGFVLSYEEYKAFKDSCALPGYVRSLHNYPSSPTVVSDDNSCVAGVFYAAQATAGLLYQQYIDSVRQEFREAYMNRCIALQPSLTMRSELKEYHYTLYYYDQAGNLVKTIPPAGVQLLSQAQIDSVQLDRLYAKENCYNYTDDIDFNGTGAKKFSNQPFFNIAADAFAWEMFVKFPTLSTQSIMSYYDTTLKRGYSLFMRGDSLVMRLHLNDSAYREFSSRPLTGTIATNMWHHLVVQRQAGIFMPVQFYLNTVPLQLHSIKHKTVFGFYPDSSYTAPLLVGGGPDQGYFTGRMKQLRIYKRALPVAEMKQNYFNACLLPAKQDKLVFWSVMNEGSGQTKDVLSAQNSASYEANLGWISNQMAVYPKHSLPTVYAYNSLNQVRTQSSPDGGASAFWYDRLGRLNVSQNAVQADSVQYSYTKYDPLGRITEVGQKQGSSFASVNPLDSAQLRTWLLTGTDKQITQTIYDAANTTLVTNTDITDNQFNLRHRVAASLYKETQSSYENATHYTYDIGGNVNKIWQEIGAMKDYSDNGIKTIDYDYDLVSGKVNKVYYQQSKGDQFIYAYNYDAENRLTSAQTSRDGINYSEQARYYYYLHGPLARMEFGDQRVQGVDYAYTLQGWIKAINGQGLDTAHNIARDGIAGSLYNRISRDVYGFTLGYHDSDYHPINSAATAINWQTYNYGSITPGKSGNGLYNGNIANTSLSLSKLDNGATKGYSYSYDQLNRLSKLNQHEVSGSAWSNTNIVDQYKESLSYDGNGNILKNSRNGKASQLSMDKMNYHYYPNSNKLAFVTDSVSASNYTEDIDNQSDTNYIYDKIGNLRSDAAEGLTSVNWTVYGKIRSITKTAGSTNINYAYDVAGNRVVKDVTTDSGAYKQFYVRDAQGNVLAIYELRDDAIKWNEQHLYGSSRIGVFNFAAAIPDTVALPSANQYVFDSALLGKTTYELSNHLGNVLTTISDKKLQVKNISDSTVDYNLAEVLSANDYYAFGMQQPGRSYSLGGYRYGFNGKENDNDVKGEGNQQDYGMRIYDSRLGKFLSVDPLQKKFPELSTYQFASNKPINSIDLDGMEAKEVYQFVYADGTSAVLEYKVNNPYKLGSGTLYHTYIQTVVEEKQINARTVEIHYKMMRNDMYFSEDIVTKRSPSLSDKIINWWNRFTKDIPQAIVFGSAFNSDNAIGGKFDPDKRTLVLDYGAASAAFSAVDKISSLGKRFKDHKTDLTKVSNTITDKVNKAWEKGKKEIPEPDIHPKGSDSCTVCAAVEPKGTMKEHTKVVPTKQEHKIKQN
jgi:RHS repeat-associated protein